MLCGGLIRVLSIIGMANCQNAIKTAPIINFWLTIELIIDISSLGRLNMRSGSSVNFHCLMDYS